MSRHALQEMYNRRYRDEQWEPLRLRPDALSTTRYDDTARLLRTEPPGGALLEIGCGSARLMIALADRFDRLTGIDLSDVRIATAAQVMRERYGDYASKISFQTASGDEPLPFDDASFDVVIACAVVEHLVDVFAAIDEIARVCRPGGCVVLTVPNICYVKHALGLLWGRLPLTSTQTRDMSYWRELGWDGGHLHYFSKAALTDLLSSAGLAAEAWTGDGRFAKMRRWYINFVGSLTVRARRTS